MSLFQPTETETPPSPAEQIATRLRAVAAANYRQICEIQKITMREVWSNGRATPQEIMDALGTAAGPLCRAHGILTAAVGQIAAMDQIVPDILMPTRAFTENPDGTITVSEDPYVPPGN